MQEPTGRSGRLRISVNLSVPLCELAGLITADGRFSEDTSHRVIRGKREIRFTSARYDRVLIDFSWEDGELIEKVTQYSAALFGIPFVELRHKTARRLQLASTQVSNSLANMGLAGKAHTKKVPQVILTAPAAYQAAYLRGLFEGDGHVTKAGDHVGLTSVNRTLLESVQTMLSFLGCHASIRRRNDSSGFSGAPRYELGLNGLENVARFMHVVGFMSSRKNGRISRVGRKSEGSSTPIKISGARLYREAVSYGLIVGSRQTVKPFIPFYKNNPSNVATLDRLLDRWGELPELKQAKTYRQRELHAVYIVSIEANGTGPVYDLSIEGVSEFLANGVVVHNCTRPNVQQIPATSDFRKCFVAAPGYKLVTCDYSQAELRILAELSGDPGFVNAFQSGGDLHSLTASQMFGVPLEEVQKSQRNAAKAINFGLAYGMGPGGLAPRLGVTLDESKELISRYFKAYPGVQKWLDKAAKDSVRNGYSATTLGRKRYYNIPDESLKRISEDDWRKQIAAIERQGKNSPIQGCLTYGSRIFEESRGYVSIGSLDGEQISVWDGEHFVGASVAYSGKKQLVKVRLRGGHYIECSPDHKFLVACNNGYKWVWKWKPITEIRAQNRVALTKPIGTWALPLNIPSAIASLSPASRANHVSVSAITDLKEMGEWLGRLASDGNISRGAVRTLIAEHEESLLDYLTGVVSNFGHVGYSIRTNEKQPARFHMLVTASRTLADQLVSFGIKERIPDFVWRNSALLSAYLRGLFDGDGTVHPDEASPDLRTRRQTSFMGQRSAGSFVALRHTQQDKPLH